MNDSLSVNGLHDTVDGYSSHFSCNAIFKRSPSAVITAWLQTLESCVRSGCSAFIIEKLVQHVGVRTRFFYMTCVRRVYKSSGPDYSSFLIKGNRVVLVGLPIMDFGLAI